MEFQVLGPVSASVEGHPVSLGGLKQRTVLALLVPEAGRAVSVDSLIAGVYGEDASSGARRTIHTYVSNLRRELGDLIVRSGPGYVLTAERSAIDAVRFEQMYQRAAGVLDSSPEQAATLLRDALALWNGHAYADVEARTVLDAEIVRLQELRLAAIEARITAELALGLHAELVGELSALVSEHPLRESFRAHQMVALYRSGRQSEALRAYSRTREYLGEELGIEPSPELQKLEQEILEQDPGLDVRPVVSIERRAVVAVELDEAARLLSTAHIDALLSRRNDILANAAAAANGSLLDIRGTAVYAAFPDVAAAIEAARLVTDDATQIAIDYGDIEVGESAPTGPVVTRSLRLAAIAHAGQVLISEDAHARLAGEGAGGWGVSALGRQDIQGVHGPAQVFQLVGRGLPADFPPLRLDRLPPPLPRATAGSVPGYELRAELGGGVFGPVHQAYQASLGREVAVRVIRPELVADPRFVRRFEAVARQIAAVEHPHLVPLLDYWREPERAFIVSRLVAGGGLEPVRSSPAPMEESLELLRRVGGAVGAAHARGMAHGRIQPSNLIVDLGGYVYLADLGLAVMFEDMVQPPSNAYTAPEAIDGGASVAADVYALGVLAAELLTGSPVPPDRGVPVVDGGAVDDVIARATAPQRADRYVSVEQFLRDLEARPAMSWTGQPSAEPLTKSMARNPFKGLVAFSEADADDFFGRSELIQRLHERVERQPFTLVVGPSGIGKSSLVRAGLIPVIRSGGGSWLVTDMFPGARPFEALEAALNRVARRPAADQVDGFRSGRLPMADGCAALTGGDPVLIVIDQFEELFTHTASEDMRRRFLDMLAVLASGSLGAARVVATIRADFLDQPLRYADFGRVVDGAAVALAAPGHDEIREIVEGPCRRVGVDVDGALLETIVRDTGSEPGALPLLEHALAELFDGRLSDTLALPDYEAVGGLAGSIGRRAESVFAGLAPEDQEAARDLFLHLVSVGPDEEPVRRRVQQTDLESLSDDGTAGRIVDAFGRHRLLVFDRDPATRVPTVEVAHEALLTRWDRLNAWIDESREDLLMGRRLEVAAHDWEAADRDQSYLLTGAQLSRAAAWRSGSVVGVEPDVARYIDESAAADERRQAELWRRRRFVLGGVAAAAVVATVLALVAWAQRGVAETERERAEVEQTLAEAQGLVLEAELAVEDPELGLLLALEAVDAFRQHGDVPARAVDAVRAGIEAQTIRHRLPGGHFVSVNGDGSKLATSPEYSIEGVAIWDLETLSLEQTIHNIGPQIVGSGFYLAGTDQLALFVSDPPSSVLSHAIEEANEEILIQEPGTGEWDADHPVRDLGDAGDIDPSGRYHARIADEVLEVWDIIDGDMLWRNDQVSVSAVAFSTDARLAYSTAGDGDPVLNIVDATTGEITRPPVRVSDPSWALEFSPDNTKVAYVGDNGVLGVVDVETGRELWIRDDLARLGGPAWLSDSSGFFTGADTRLRLIDAGTGAIVRTVEHGRGDAVGYALIPGTDLLAVAGQLGIGAGDDGWIFLVDITGEQPEVRRFEMPFARSVTSRVSQNGEVMLIHNPLEFALVSTDDGRPLLHHRAEPDDLLVDPAAGFAVASRNGEFVAGFDGERYRVWRTADATSVYTAPEGWTVRGVSDDGAMVAAFQPEMGTRIVNTTTGAELHELDAGPRLQLASFSPDGRFVVTNDGGSGDRLTTAAHFPGFKIWNLASAEHVGTIDFSNATYRGLRVEFTSDSEQLIVGGEDGFVTVFDFEELSLGASPEAAERLRWEAHDRFITSVRLSPDETMLATNAFDEPVILWDLETGARLGDFGEAGGSVAFDPVHPHLFVAEDGIVSVHTLDLDELIAIAESRLTRSMTEEECLTYLDRPCGA